MAPSYLRDIVSARADTRALVTWKWTRGHLRPRRAGEPCRTRRQRMSAGEPAAEADQAMAVLAKAVGMRYCNVDEFRAQDMLVPFRVCEDLPLLLLGMAHPPSDSSSRREPGAPRRSRSANPGVATWLQCPWTWARWEPV
jgi:hypothetical protein